MYGRRGWSCADAIVLAALALAVAAACVVLLPATARADAPSPENGSAWADLSVQGSSTHYKAIGELASFDIAVRSGGLDEGESLLMSVDGLPSNWSSSLSDTMPSTWGNRIPSGDSTHTLTLELGDSTPARVYPFEVRVDRSRDLSTLARLALEVEVTSYAFTIAMDDMPDVPVMPGRSIVATISVSHDAPQGEVATVSFRSVPRGWQAFVGTPSFTVDPGGNGLSQVLIRIPEDAASGSHQVILDVGSVDPRFVPRSYMTEITVMSLPGLRAKLHDGTEADYESGLASFLVDVSNPGNAPISVTNAWMNATALGGWSVRCNGLPALLLPGGNSTLEVTVSYPTGHDIPLAGEHVVPLTLGTSAPGIRQQLDLAVVVPEVPTLGLVTVYSSSTSPMDFDYASVQSADSFRAPGTTELWINPYEATSGLGYVEVQDLGNLGRYREVTLKTDFASPITSAVLTKPTISLWSGRSWVVGVEIAVERDAPTGLYRVNVSASDRDGNSATTRIDVRLFHVSARMEGDLRVVTPEGTKPADHVDVGDNVAIQGTVVNDGEYNVSAASVLIYDVHGDNATLYETVQLRAIPAGGAQDFDFQFDADSSGEHKLEAVLVVPGGVPSRGTSAALSEPINAQPVVPARGAALLPLLLGMVAGLGVGLLTIVGTEAGRFVLVSMLLLPLYTRLRPQQVTDQFVRGQILGYVKANPGETYTSIRRALRLSNGQFVYHARVLETQGLIRSVKDGANRRFYPADMRIPSEIKDLKLNQVQRIIYTIVMEYPGISQRKIARLVNLTPSTVSYHVNIMTKIGVLERRRSGRLMICFANGKGE